MAAITNISNLTATTNFYELVTYTNNVTEGALVGGFAITFLIVVLLLMIRRYDFMSALMATSFLCFVLSIFFVAIDLLNFWYLIAFGVIMAFSVFYVYFTNRY